MWHHLLDVTKTIFAELISKIHTLLNPAGNQLSGFSWIIINIREMPDTCVDVYERY